MSSSLELDGAEGVRGAELRVLADRPLLRQAVILGQAIRLIILTGRDARGQAHMLTYQAAAAAPAGDGEEEGGPTMRCQVKGDNAVRTERLSERQRHVLGPELPWQLVIRLSCADWEESGRGEGSMGP